MKEDRRKRRLKAAKLFLVFFLILNLFGPVLRVKTFALRADMPILELPGDLLAKAAGGGAFDTGHTAAIDVAAGSSFDLRADLDVKAVQDQMKSVEAGFPSLSYSMYESIQLANTATTFTAIFVLPPGLSKSDLSDISFSDGGKGLFEIAATPTLAGNVLTVTIQLKDADSYTNYKLLHDAIISELGEKPAPFQLTIPGIQVGTELAEGEELSIAGNLNGEMNATATAGNNQIQIFPFLWKGVQSTSTNSPLLGDGRDFFIDEEDSIALTVKVVKGSETPEHPAPPVVVEPTVWEHSKSKTATNLNADYVSDITLSLPSAEEQLVSDIVFVLDKSSCKQETAAKAQALLQNLKNALGASNAKAKIAVLAFDGTAHQMLPLTDFTGTDAQMTEILQYMAVNSIPESERVGGTNMQAGLLMAKQMLDSDGSVEPQRKYLVLVSDGLTRLFSDSNGKVKDIYWQTLHGGMDGQTPEDHISASSFVYYGMIGEWSVARTGLENYAWPIIRPNCPDWASYYGQLKAWVEADGDTYAMDFLTYGNDATAKVKAADGSIIDNNFRYIPYKEYDKHAMSVDRAVYEAYNVYIQMVQSGYQCFASNVGTSAFGTAFMNELNRVAGKNGELDFTSIQNDILYLAGAGSRVDDYMGFVEGDYNFDLFEPQNMMLTLDNTTNGTIEIFSPELISENRYGFAEDTSGKYKYEVTYVPGSKGADEHFIWTMNVPVSNFEHVSLKYQVKLMNPKTEAGTYGVFDATGAQMQAGLYTNQKAILMPMNSAGNAEAAEEFLKPTVSYTVTAPAPGQGTVKVQHLDEAGNSLANEETLTGTIGEAYTSTAKEITGYSFKELKAGSAPASGTFAEEAQVVTYVYAKKPAETESSIPQPTAPTTAPTRESATESRTESRTESTTQQLHVPLIPKPTAPQGPITTGAVMTMPPASAQQPAATLSRAEVLPRTGEKTQAPYVLGAAAMGMLALAALSLMLGKRR